jgi:hypothetical protein
MRCGGNTAMLGLVGAMALAGALAADGPQPSRPEIRFLDAKQAAGAVVSEEHGPYFSLMQTLEMSAKTGRAITGDNLQQQRDECRRRYGEATLDFSPDEIAEITWVINELHAYLESEYSKIAELDWSLIKLDSSIEGGMAHTRGPHIVLPSTLLQAATSRAQRSRAERLSVLGMWLLHEQIHVAQRVYPEIFEQLYTDVWGFRRVDFGAPHPWLVKHQLINPDAVESAWIYPMVSGETVTWIWPTVLLGESRGIRRLLGVPSLTGDMRQVAIQLHTSEGGVAIAQDGNGLPVIRNLLSLREYRAEFPYSLAPFHPHEIAAEGFARLAIIDLTAPYPDGRIRVRRWADPRTGEVRRWFSRNLD